MGEPGNDIDLLSYLAMKEKFSHIYKRLEKYKNKGEATSIILEQKFGDKYYDNPLMDSKIARFVDGRFSPEICKIKTSSHLQKANSPAVVEPL